MILTWDEYCAFDNKDPLVDIEDKSRIELLISSAQATIENTCERLFDAIERTLETDAKSQIVLPSYPVTALQIFIDPTGVFGAGTDVTSLTYLNKNNGIISFRCFNYEPFTPAKIVWTGGLSTIPGDLKLAAYKIVKWDDQRTLQGRYGVRSVQSGEASTTYETTIPADVRQTLDFYKRGF